MNFLLLILFNDDLKNLKEHIQYLKFDMIKTNLRLYFFKLKLKDKRSIMSQVILAFYHS